MKNLETLIPFERALEKVLNEKTSFGTKKTALSESLGYILAQDVRADRDFPPFDRSIRDGIAVHMNANENVQGKRYPVEGIAAAGSPQLKLKNPEGCIEIMTGAMLPKGCNTVVMYEHIQKEGNTFLIQEPAELGQNIHKKGCDVGEEGLLLQPNTKIRAADIGVLATVGISEVLVKSLPKVAIIATGNELVSVNETPLPYQIRSSNSHTLMALLKNEGIHAEAFHIKDDPTTLEAKIKGIFKDFDVLLLSGGVSKGKYDFLPEVFAKLGVEKIFHKVLQRPGKPFWFGKQSSSNTLVFAFPGNPVSTYVNYHIYFKGWLAASLAQKADWFSVRLDEVFENKTPLDLFVGVNLKYEQGEIKASPISTSGSGDLAVLTKIDGFARLQAQAEPFAKNEAVPFLPTKPLLV